MSKLTSSHRIGKQPDRQDSFNPDDTDLETSELMELVSSRLKEAIEDTANTRRRLDKTLTSLEQRGVL